MPPSINRIPELSFKYLTGELTAGEKSELDALLSRSAANQELFRELTDLDQLARSIANMQKLEPELYWTKIQEKVAARKQMRNQQKRIILRWAIAAAAMILLVTTSTWYLTRRRTDHPVAKEQKVTTPVPEDLESFILLSDGRKLFLDELQNGPVMAGTTQITKQGDEIIYGNASSTQEEPEIHRISVKRGKKYILVLSDNSRIALNAATAMRFPVIFTGSNRSVQISGEGYFDIKDKKAQPFKAIIVSNALDTNPQKLSESEALGTHFNIKAYANEPRQTITLDQGLLRVYHQTDSTDMQAGEQVTINITDKKAKLLKTKPKRPADATAWRKGLFRFTDTDIQTIMREVARQYGIKVIYTGAVPQKKITLYAEHSQPLEQILNMLRSQKIDISVKDNEVNIGVASSQSQPITPIPGHS